MNSHPIEPDHAKLHARVNIHPAVIKAVNDFLVSSKFARRGVVTIRQDELIKRIIEVDPQLTKQMLFDNNWLDFEEMFRDVGWSVYYDRPAYNENYEASFEFKRAWWYELQPELRGWMAQYADPQDERAWSQLVKIIRSAKVKAA